MRLSPKQQRALAALLTSPTLGEAAKQANLGQATLFRYLQEPAFQESYRAARREIVQHAMAKIQHATEEAVEVLVGLMKDKNTPSGSRISAARTILDTTFRAIELEDLGARLTVLESLQKNDGRESRGFSAHG